LIFVPFMLYPVNEDKTMLLFDERTFTLPDDDIIVSLDDEVDTLDDEDDSDSAPDEDDDNDEDDDDRPCPVMLTLPYAFIYIRPDDNTFILPLALLTFILPFDA
jgi:hypothetical protein